ESVLRTRAFGDDDVALALEHPGHGVRLGEIAAVLGEEVPKLGAGPVVVVRHGLDQNGRAAWAVPLVGLLLENLAGELPGPLLDRPLDVVRGHVVALRLLDRGPEPRVPLCVAAAHPGGDRDLL